ncbi:MAG: hypothetical protein F9K18_10135 [Thermoanaerobaculia bacterium]|nr:MAG: hypothetical protein F9K18_10135 [Thermoanaerobaculia bacterium]
MNDLLQGLIEFHRAARELAATRELLGGVPEEMRALHDEFTAAQSALDALEESALAAHKARLTAEGAISDAQERLRKFQQQVPKVRNQREYAALLTEIDGAKAEIKRLEEQALGALEEADNAAGELATRKADFGELEARYAEGLAAWEARKPEVARRAAELEAEAERLRAELPRPILAQYHRISDKYRGEALSPLRRSEGPGAGFWFCSTCNYQVRPQVAMEVRTRGVIVQCEGCRRFLSPGEEG